MQDYVGQREEKYKEDSKVRLSKIMKKKVETTMIGAIASIEAHFGHLWEDDEEYGELFQTVRKEILDRGNTQSRNIDAELSQYDVKWNRYQTTIPIKIKDGQ